jgi:hypothetical protein
VSLGVAVHYILLAALPVERNSNYSGLIYMSYTIRLFQTPFSLAFDNLRIPAARYFICIVCGFFTRRGEKTTQGVENHRQAKVLLWFVSALRGKNKPPGNNHI